MGVLNATQWPLSTLPVGYTNNGAIAAQSQTPTIDNDPTVMNNARYEKLMDDHSGTAQYGSHHAEPSGGRGGMP